MAFLKRMKEKCLNFICKHERIFYGILVGLLALFFILLGLPLLPKEWSIISFFLAMFFLSYAASVNVVRCGTLSKEPLSLSTLGITLLITGFLITFFIVPIGILDVMRTISTTQEISVSQDPQETIIPKEIRDMLLQVSLNFLLGGIGLIGVAFPILLSSMRGECCCKTERPSQHTECNTSKKESEGEKVGSLS